MNSYIKKIKSFLSLIIPFFEEDSNENLQSDFSYSKKLYKNFFTHKAKVIIGVAVLGISLVGFIFLFRRDNNTYKSELKNISMVNNDFKAAQNKENIQNEGQYHNDDSDKNESIPSCNKKRKILKENESEENKKVVKEKSDKIKKCKKSRKDNLDNSNSVSPEESNKKSSNVYITGKGFCYHLKKCGKGNYYSVSLDEAKAKGLRPCKKCCK